MLFSGDIAQPHLKATKVFIPSELKTKVWLGNLEGSLVDISNDKDNRKGVYNSLDAICRLVEQIPFKAFGIANNHLLDVADVNTSRSNAESLAIPLVGAGSELIEAQSSITIHDTDGICYRILAFGWENIQCVSAEKRKQGVNPFTRANVIKCVKDAVSRSEQVICFMHWNYELERYPQPYDRRFAMEMIDMGVSAVIGCHAHRVQPIEFYKGKPIVYGLGNFVFCQGHYFGGKLCFPSFCQEEYVFEITKQGYRLHYFIYDQYNNRLDYVKSEDVGQNQLFDGRAVFSGYTDKEYEVFFKKHRVQKKLLPIFYANESAIGYWMKSKWIKTRGLMINMLTKMNLKSANRANR